MLLMHILYLYFLCNVDLLFIRNIVHAIHIWLGMRMQRKWFIQCSNEMCREENEWVNEKALKIIDNKFKGAVENSCGIHITNLYESIWNKSTKKLVKCLKHKHIWSYRNITYIFFYWVFFVFLFHFLCETRVWIATKKRRFYFWNPTKLHCYTKFAPSFLTLTHIQKIYAIQSFGNVGNTACQSLNVNKVLRCVVFVMHVCVCVLVRACVFIKFETISNKPLCLVAFKVFLKHSYYYFALKNVLNSQCEDTSNTKCQCLNWMIMNCWKLSAVAATRLYIEQNIKLVEFRFYADDIMPCYWFAQLEINSFNCIFSLPFIYSINS